MAKWNPPNKVGRNEPIGRRLFDEPMLAGATDQQAFDGIRITHFEETRGTQISLDRLGGTGVDRKVVNYLLPRARAAGKKFSKPKPFDGWAFIRADKLANAPRPPSFQVTSSPVNELEPDDNIYHAHVERPNDMSSYSMALHLRHLFTHYGDIKSIARIGQKSGVGRWFTNNALVNFVREVWRSLRE